MRILLLSNKSPWPPKDGGSSATLGLIKGLSRSGAEVTVLAINTSRHHADTDKVAEKLGSKTDLHLVNLNTGINPVRLIINLFFSSKPYNIYRFRSKKYGKKLSEILKDHYDIIQIEGLAMTIYFDQIRKVSDTKVIFRPHNIENKIWAELSSEPCNIVHRLYFRNIASRLEKYETAILNKFDAVVPITGTDHNWFKKAGLNIPSLVIPSGIFNTHREAGYELNLSVFFIGALDWLPNIYGIKWFLRKVWPLIASEEAGATFHIAGRGCSKRMARYFKAARIFYHGEVESSASFIGKYSVMVVPLFSGSGLRIKIIEAMGAGRSIVATPVAADGIIFRNGKDLFIASDPGKFAGRVLALLKNKELRNETGRQAMENVIKNYDILAESKSLLKFYSKLP